MQRFTSYVRRPVKRHGAEQYLLITLLSFAGSVSLTRMFLALTGYPQLGGGELHIAHVLWGGLLLFLAGLLPLLIANRWVYVLGAILSGIGVGLFIDEVGKFITQNNDYFYPLAAPIIYAFFLLTVIVYLRVRRPAVRGPRAELYRAFDVFEEVLEHDLEPEEKKELEERLRYVAQQTSEPELARLASDLLKFLTNESLKVAPERATIWENALERWHEFEQRRLHRPLLRAILAGGLLAMGLVALTTMFQALPIGQPPNSLMRLLTRLIEEGQLRSFRGLNWFLARLALETSVGILLMISAGFFIAGNDRYAAAFGYLSLLLSLTTVNLLVFYFDQFSSILPAAIQLALLLGILYYRKRFLTQANPPPTPPESPEIEIAQSETSPQNKATGQ